LLQIIRTTGADGGQETGHSNTDEGFDFCIDPEKRLVVVTFGKRLTLAQIRQYVDALRADPSFVREFSEIADLRALQDLDLHADEFIKLADQIDPFSPDAKRAFVVETSAQNHAARMHKILLSTRKIEIFRSLRKAEEWIGC
jgi:hypothetical protein